MADKKKFEEVNRVVSTVTTTDETPAEADKTSVPNAMDAEGHEPPLRSNAPVAELAQVLADGAGRHLPPTDPHIGADGRWYADVADARSASIGYQTEDELDARYGKAKAASAK